MTNDALKALDDVFLTMCPTFSMNTGEETQQGRITLDQYLKIRAALAPVDVDAIHQDGFDEGFESGKLEATEFDRDLRRAVFGFLEKRGQIENGEEYTAQDIMDCLVAYEHYLINTNKAPKPVDVEGLKRDVKGLFLAESPWLEDELIENIIDHLAARGVGVWNDDMEDEVKKALRGPHEGTDAERAAFEKAFRGLHGNSCLAELMEDGDYRTVYASRSWRMWKRACRWAYLAARGCFGVPIEEHRHVYGNMAAWPRKCMVCGADEFEAEQAPTLDKILTEAHKQLKEHPAAPKKEE